MIIHVYDSHNIWDNLVAKPKKVEDYLAHRIYCARQSEDPSLTTLANQVMIQLDLFPPEDAVKRICEDSASGIYHLQFQAALALSELLRAEEIPDEAEDYAIPEENCAELADEAIDRLDETYRSEYELASPRYDDVGRLLKNSEDRSLRRLGFEIGKS